MKKSVITLLSAVALLAGCVHNEIPDNTTLAGDRTFTLTASTPGDDSGSSGTRLALSENEEGITVKWKEGDALNLCFVSGTTVKTVSAVAVTNIRNGSKTGDFAIDIPVEITAPFDLYGVYGAEFKTTDSKEVILPAPSGAALSDSEPLCVLRFEAKNLTGATPVSVSFSHVGALLGVSLINGSESNYTVNSLSVASSGSNWLFNATGQATYNIATGEFSDNKEGNALIFPSMAATIAGGTSEKAYCWFVPVVPAVSAENRTVTLNGEATTQPLPAKTFTGGKYYRLVLAWDGTEWKHTRMPLSTNLVAHWPFDGNANDAVGGNHGTVYGATLTADRFGNPNSAYNFDGDDYIQCLQTGISGTAARSISFWAKAGTLSSGGNNVIISYGGTASDAGGRFEIGLRPDRLEVDISSGMLSKEYTNIGDGNWHFYTIVFEGGTGKTLSDLKYYADGRLLTVDKGWSGSASINTLTTNPINMGRLQGVGRHFKGAIDDIRMYNNALSAEEIIWLYQSESIGMAVNSLSRFATHNLDVLNTFAAGDEQTTKGKMYQWGRNIPFPAEGDITIVGGIAASLNDPKIWSDDFIVSAAGSWHPSPNRTDTWRSLIAQASSAPESYRGTNTRYPGDPCPDGWHLPSPAEWTAILPFSGATYGFSFNDHSDRSEAIDLDNDGTPEDYLADYRKITDNSMVGLKYKGTSLATAFKYEWISATNAMKISAVRANAFTTIGQVRDASFDWSGAVVRYFPTAGNRSFGYGTIDATYSNMGFYWTSEAAPDATYDIWLAYIKNTTAYITRDDAGSILAKRGNGYLVRCIKN